MSPGDWLRNGLSALVPRVWGRECPRGTPVPLPGPCADCDSVRLTELALGETARVSCLQDPGSRLAVRLASAGVLPGTALRLLQRRPAYVIRLGFCDLALDRESAHYVRVRPDAATPRPTRD